MNFNIFNSIILAGVIQGFIFGAIVLFSKKYKHKNVYFLTAVIVIYSFSNLQFYLNDIGAITYDELFRYYYVPWGNLVPVLLYFYVFLYLNANYKFSKKQYALVLPFMLSFTLALIYKIARGVNNTNSWVEDLKFYLEGYDELLTALFHVIILSVLISKVTKYKKLDYNSLVGNIRLHVDWITNSFIMMLIVIIGWITLTMRYIQNPDDVSFYPFWIALAMLIYWFGHIGIYKYGIVEQRKKIRQKKLLATNKTKRTTTKHIIIERLKIFLEDEKRFLDSSLTLEKTAEALELSQGHLSKIINTELHMSYKDYLNKLRVDEAKSYLKDSNFSNYTLVAIGLEAGFNSKSAFNMSFKKLTGETPSQFKKRHAN